MTGVWQKWVIRCSFAFAGLLLLSGVVALYILNIDQPERHQDPESAFKYGSTGGDKNFGLPYVVWQVLPAVFPELLPQGGEGYGAFGFITESAQAQGEAGLRLPRPIGTSLRNFQGIDRIFLNCAACHAGRVRVPGEANDRIYLGMPANTVNLQAFQTFLTKAAADERFNPPTILAEIDRQNLELSLLNRLILRYYGIGVIRDRLQMIGERLSFGDHQPEFGPGRYDTFSSAKALFNWPIEKIPQSERVGVVDFPSIWLQAQRDGMQLHWDGNNTKLSERDRSAAFGTGATPPLLDREYLLGVEAWLADLEPPPFPVPIDGAKAEAGQTIYAQNCALCHGSNGRDFAPGQGRLGTVIGIGEIGTDRSRLDNYTYDLSVNQSQLYAMWGDERFSHFRKTNGYAAAPLDGIWLRAPYLHNGAVPTLRDLLRAPNDRPKAFYRGAVSYDLTNVGFVTDLKGIETAPFGLCFRVSGVPETVCPASAAGKIGCESGTCAGNGNQGHAYGITLSDTEKMDLIEYLKTF